MSEIDWDVARRVANKVAHVRQIDDISDLPAGVSVPDAALLISAYMGIAIPANLPTRETLSRCEWIDADLEKSRLELAAHHETRRRERRRTLRMRGWCGRYWRSVALGIKTGRGAKSQEGEYVRYAKPVGLAPRLLVIAPNVKDKVSSLETDLDAFVSWVTIHEVAHMLQFAGVPWLDDHVENLESRVRQVTTRRRGSRAARRAVNEQVALLEEILEGHAEHVTDVVATEMGTLPHFNKVRMPLRPRLVLLARKMQTRLPRYRDWQVTVVTHPTSHKVGFDFCKTIANAGFLNQLWRSPETLPNSAEIKNPEEWLARTQQ